MPTLNRASNEDVTALRDPLAGLGYGKEENNDI